MGSRSILLVALLLGIAGCGGRQSAGADIVRYTGRIVVSGAEGMTETTVSVEGRAPVGITGPLLREIRSLAGATLMVEGVPAAQAMGAAVDVRRYDVIEVNGERPYVGIMTRTGEDHAIRRDDGTTIALEAVPAALGAATGAKVWVTGRLRDGRVQVQSFGIIRPPSG